MIKVDLKKAYESIEWGFLIDVMKALGFPSLFTDWIYACVSSVSYSILLNGIPCAPFYTKKGLRQGDPFSPFMFSIGMEYLSRRLMQLKVDPNFNFHPRCERMNLTHMFADDLLMFSRADPIYASMMFY